LADYPQQHKVLPVPDRAELRLALQRLASGYYNRPEVIRAVARRILQLERLDQER
jgi:hypothetical protein